MLPTSREKNQRWSDIRNLCSFWILGLCNNYGYVIMLSAAHDILNSQESHDNLTTPSPPPVPSNSSLSTISPSSNHSGRDLHCTVVGTGAILLADILPSLAIKLFAAAVIQKIHFHVKVILCVLLAVSSFVIVALSTNIGTSIIGVIFASASAGLGEITFLSMTAYFGKNVVSTWSSGTGAAGVVGAVSYAGLTQLVSPKVTLFIILFVPLLIWVVYFILLDRPPKFGAVGIDDDAIAPLIVQDESDENDGIASFKKQEEPSWSLKFHLFKKLLPLMIPLALVYFFEYLINQALFELMIFDLKYLTHAEQYRWFQVLYQVGVFISRSSVNIMRVRKTWILAVLQAINFVVLLVHVIIPFVPSVWIIFVVILYEGLLGGLAYVNTFYRITLESEAKYREFNMATASLGDAIGITLSGIIAVQLHSLLCQKLST